MLFCYFEFSYETSSAALKFNAHALLDIVSENGFLQLYFAIVILSSVLSAMMYVRIKRDSESVFFFREEFYVVSFFRVHLKFSKIINHSAYVDKIEFADRIQLLLTSAKRGWMALRQRRKWKFSL